MVLNFRQNKALALNLLVTIAILVIALGTASLIGWVLDIGILKSVLPHFINMKFNTALCFVMAGASFLLLLKYTTPLFKFLFKLLAACFGLLALVSLCQDVLGWSAGIDQFFVADTEFIIRGFPNPGRMSSATASCFVFLSIGLLNVDAKKNAYRAIAQYVLHIVTILSFACIVGFIIQVPYSQNFSFFSSMALNTAFCFFSLSVGASTINYTLGITSLFAGRQIGNIVARKLFPRMAVILIVLAYISIESQRKHYITTEFGAVVAIVGFLLIGLFLIRNTLLEMNAIDLKRAQAEAETQLMNKNLEQLVQQRTLALGQSNQLFEKIFKASPICITLADLTTGVYADINPAFSELLGYQRDEVIGHTAAELGIISTQYRQSVVDLLAARGQIRNEEIVLMGKHSEKRALLNAEMLESANQKFMMTFVYDITESKQMETTLLDSKKSLEILTDKLTNQNKQLLSFAHIISHNLRAPVSNLNLLVHLFKESTTPDDKEELWHNFETVTEHLNSTLNDLLDTLRIQEETDKHREELSFEKILSSVYQILIGQVMESKADIKSDFSRAKHLLYPKMYLESIMLNLISNALKYSSPNRPPVITVTSNLVDGATVLTVQDNGLGINLERHGKNLFGLRKTFHRHSEARGLGLFITKTQIEAMGGEILVESEVDKGTKFVVVFNKK